MKCKSYFYNCSKEYVSSIDRELVKELTDVIKRLPKRTHQTDINKDFFWILTEKGWSYDSTPKGLPNQPPSGLVKGATSLSTIKSNNNRNLCVTSTTLGARWCADFTKAYSGRLVQIEVQFGTVESMFKDFCGFKIGSFERRVSLGIEIVLCTPNKYFAHRKAAIAGMAYFDIAKNTLPAIGLNCPIWLIGIEE